jgi:hypothetical protein
MKTLLISLMIATVAGVSASYAADAQTKASSEQSPASSNDNGGWQLKKSPRAHHKGQYANSISLN